MRNDITKDEVLIFLKNNKEYLKTHFYIIKIGIFGSFARGEQTKNSDIDFIIEMEDTVDNIFRTKNKLRNFLQDNFHREVDIIEREWIKPRVKDFIENDAIYV